MKKVIDWLINFIILWTVFMLFSFFIIGMMAVVIYIGLLIFS